MSISNNSWIPAFAGMTNGWIIARSALDSILLSFPRMRESRFGVGGLMKYTAIAVLLLLSSASIVVDACYAQSFDILTGLHPRPQVSYFQGRNQPKTITKAWYIEYDMLASKTGTM